MSDVEHQFGSGHAHSVRERVLEARRHGRRVRSFGSALFFAAGAILAFGVLATALATLAIPTPELGDMDVEDGRVVMGAPKLEGRNSSDQPYRIEAESALQSPDDLNRLELRGITGELPLGSDSRVAFNSDAGFYDAENQFLDFLSPLDLETSAGDTALVQDGRIDLLAGSFVSDKPVRLKTETTTLTADSVRIDSRSRTILFKGSVRMQLVPDDVRPQANASETPPSKETANE
ncbi:hypothetical protein [Notoacmeibacter ruber]|uniref:LPS export ABC transporter periplasmic protein LptC n=1 Tax=Notoacmeibacter ruber TaxID=2670375 RepID=A0A3L7JBK1_9HYPH|nr:hypothetical protein [Notoacmeibacter ruber]RLQ86901.1 hypothetical protein D8780_00475 [Notoacmeibacter ruber]